MKPETFVHKPTEVRAVQVVRPYSDVTSFLPRSRIVKKASGAFSHVHLVDAKEPAGEGDWVLKFPSGFVQVWSDEQFKENWG
jgi:hypothetical protein